MAIQVERLLSILTALNLLQAHYSVPYKRTTLIEMTVCEELQLVEKLGGERRSAALVEEYRMRVAGIFAVLAFTMLLPRGLCAQEFESDKINSNLGVSLSLPVAQTSQFWATGWGTSVGAGYNFNERHSAIGEFNWNRIYEDHSTLINPVRGFNDILSVTGNYRFELRRKSLGTYFIGGAGWYHSVGGSAPGGNGGIGFTVKTSEPSYRLYLEARYNYAPTRLVSTQFVNITFGIRY